MYLLRHSPERCGIVSNMDIPTFHGIQTISCRKDIAKLFWENKLGIDVDDDYRFILFEGSESLAGGAPLNTRLMLGDGSNRPSDRFLRLHFKECLVFTAGRGDVWEDYGHGEIERFIEELGVYDDEIDPDDPRWLTPLGNTGENV